MKEITRDILEGNKLIAVFDGYEPRFVTYPNPQLNRWEVDRVNQWQPMKYHTSWDWLMPVVEKINKTNIPDNKHPANVIIYRTTCHINDDRQILIETTLKTSLIDCVWRAVIQFIKWYNQNHQ